MFSFFSRQSVFLISLILTGTISFSQQVNPFTGSFEYNRNLLHIPSNRGTGVDISASYGAGIQMNQSASEIGLGWNLEAGGAIYRNVSGVPDDAVTYSLTNFYSNTTEYCQGALYPRYNSAGGVNTITNYDLFKTTRGLDTTEFTMPDFDSYSLVSPGFSGQLRLGYHKFYSYYMSSGTYGALMPGSSSSYYRKPQFHFINDFADTLTSRHYSTTINGSTPFRDPSSTVTGLGYTNSTESFIGPHTNGSTITNENFDIPTGRYATSNLIEYFSNAEINAANTAGFASGPLATFIDYKSSHARTSVPDSGIGAFRVTLSNALTYHYSLPVYALENTTYKFPLENDYSIDAGITTAAFDVQYDVNGLPSSSNSVIIKAKNANKYAVKWLLTAITGPDYVDSNNNHVADDGDAGYWVSFNYEQWSGGFTTRTPQYGYDYQYENNTDYNFYPLYFNKTDALYKLSGMFGVVNVSKTEIYHLSKIRTSSHTALFVRAIRLDEKGSKDTVSYSHNFKPAPDLALKRILLYKNEQLDSLTANSSGFTFPSATFSTSANPLFDFGTVNNTAPFYTEEWYARTSTVTAFGGYCVLKNVEFDQDYSLCRKYHGNANVSYVNSSVLTTPSNVESNISVTTYSTSGKLTLNRIITYELANQKVTPSIKFDYDQTNTLTTLSNPDFSVKKLDYWGYYKSDATQNAYSRYTSPSSKNYTKAWSLLKITDPLGGITQIEYESNSYNKVLDIESSTGFRGPAFIYRILTAPQIFNLTYTTAKLNFLIEEQNTYQNMLTELNYITPGVLPSVTAKVCVPYVCQILPQNQYCTPLLEHGFYFGDFTYTINPGGSPNYSNNNFSANITNTSKGAYNWQTANQRKFTSPTTTYNDTYSASSFPSSATTLTNTYSGNGFLLFETPNTYDAYGSGVRVKRLKHTNGAAETYTMEYTYEGGVATNECDRFEYPRLKTRCAGSALRYDFLMPKDYSKFDIAPYIGYSKVTIRNLGSANVSNGKVESTFITDPTSEGGIFNSNYKNTFYTGYYTVVTAFTNTLVNECVNKFAAVFGSTKETRVFDKNDNMLTRTVNQYTTTQQGALSENYYFSNSTYFAGSGYSSATSNTVNILRDYPIVLKNTTTYGMGNYETTETIVRDEVTGETTSMRSSGRNNSNSTSYKLPAYKFYQSQLELLDFKSRSFRTILPLSQEMYAYSNVDTTITTNSFLSATYKLFGRSVRKRAYSSGLYSISGVTLPFYINNRNFVYDGGRGSMNNYGLLDKSNLHTNEIQLSTVNNYYYWVPPSSCNWKLISEVSLLDEYNHTVETRDANSRFSACRFGYNGYYKTASVTNCTFRSFTFADFETVAPNSGVATIDGDVIINTTNHPFIGYSTIMPHTGSQCIQVTSAPLTYTAVTEKNNFNTFDIGLLPGRIYRASVWVHSTNYLSAALTVTVSGTILPSTPVSNTYSANANTNLVTTIGNWNLIQIDFPVPDNYSTSGGQFRIELKSHTGSTVYFDDFLFHPVESDFGANVYNPRNGRIMSSIDGNGFATNYFYDAAGRTTEIWKEIPSVGYKKIKKHTYNFARGTTD